ncbi:SDR family NAD(P)-dependent oxidoreductase [Streptomyces sp. KN37]|uniref:SDR family NAD(P)-dependent oxidoreductase n=1 Tax=Streptomyces sp. KN37 TaxID=3090667 RepID=UPI002A75B100|nr:SDR family NAD(P)-dependent oxidoreductase [Streptomyces sp. KN37]WPO76676.1 SDR family NAD(P)-dependent oxidoreductase [Streptomyces sp. KN37]
MVLAPETPDEEALVSAAQTHLAAPERKLVRAEAGTTAAEWQRAIGTPEADVHLVLLLGEVSPDNAALVPHATRRGACLRAMAQACTALPANSRAWIWLITRPSGALPSPELPTAPADAAAWGTARTLANEFPDLHVRRVSLARSSRPEDDARRLADELRACGEEDEVALTGNGRFVPRVLPLPATAPRLPDCYALSVRRPGLSYELAWRETARPAPGPGEVVVQVRATALNYRDIMTVTSLLPPEAQEFTQTTVPGLECAGVVIAVGDRVTGLRAGDRVYGMIPGSFASHILTAAEFLQPIPDGMTFEGAATLPICFATVHHTLANLAHLREGETVLVHGGAGGIGLAVLQFAARRKARVIATAGSEAKRALLRTLGVQHVLDSRSLDFAHQVEQLTEGRGVDVVVNSLAGEAMSRSLELLGPGGRFIELGKLDILDNNPLALRPFLNNLTFFGFDLAVLTQQPEQARSLAKQVTRHVQAGHYRPLPHSVYPASRVREAFELMQHSRHIGKVVVAFDPHDEPPAVEPLPRHVQLDPDGTYLITGGLSGFGAATARWLTDRGARHLALVSRRGPDTPEAPALLEELSRRGVRARAYRADVTDEQDVHALLDGIDAGPHRLRGVVHCAMHLDDAPLEELTDTRFSAVLAPKMEGAAVLDRLTRSRHLDLFLLISSASADIGNIHQAPYVSGNLYLEALSRQRREAKLPAQTIAWGSLDETGYVARNNLTAQLAAVGMKPLALKDAFAAADDILTRGFPVAGTGHYNWDRARGLLPLIATPRYSLIVPPYEEISDRPREEFLASLAGLSPAQARETLQKAVTRNLAKAMQMEPEALDPHRRLDEYGLDSLMATELLASVRQQFNVVIPPMELLRSGTTIHDLTGLLHLRLGLTEPPTPATSSTSSPTQTIPDQPAGSPTPDSLAPAKAAL